LICMKTEERAAFPQWPRLMKCAGTASGLTWMGPQKCRLALVNGTIVGVALEDRQVVVWYGSTEEVPAGIDRPAAFERAFAALEKDLLAGRARTKALSLSEIFRNDQRVRPESEIVLKDISLRDGSLVLKVHVNNPRLAFELALASDLSAATPRQVERD
jgi:hypothetical protein